MLVAGLKTASTGSVGMGTPGLTELLVMAGIILVLVGIPIAIIVFVILLLKRKNRD